jgi:hypothetical protein
LGRDRPNKKKGNVMSIITTPAIGTKMPDRTIYAGVSPNTGKPMYTTPKDAPMRCAFNEAAAHASSLDAHGHKDWRVPTKAELNMLFVNCAEIGSFDTMGFYPAGWYWSSALNHGVNSWVQRFSDGFQGIYLYGYNQAALRCVRG